MPKQLLSEPNMQVQEFTFFGQMSIKFNQDLVIPESLSNTLIKTGSQGSRRSRQMTEQVDLNHFISFELIRSMNEKAEVKELMFDVELKEFNVREMILQFDFINPLSISTGDISDIIRFTILQPDLFVSSASGLTIQKDTTVEVEVPR